MNLNQTPDFSVLNHSTLLPHHRKGPRQQSGKSPKQRNLKINFHLSGLHKCAGPSSCIKYSSQRHCSWLYWLSASGSWTLQVTWKCVYCKGKMAVSGPWARGHLKDRNSLIPFKLSQPLSPCDRDQRQLSEREQKLTCCIWHFLCVRFFNCAQLFRIITSNHIIPVNWWSYII